MYLVMCSILHVCDQKYEGGAGKGGKKIGRRRFDLAWLVLQNHCPFPMKKWVQGLGRGKCPREKRYYTCFSLGWH
jgi:hypothetical protein